MGIYIKQPQNYKRSSSLVGTIALSHIPQRIQLTTVNKCSTMQFLSTIFAVAVMATGATACVKRGSKCTMEQYNKAVTMCECNAGTLLICREPLDAFHLQWDFFYDCPKTKNGRKELLENDLFKLDANALYLDAQCHNGDCDDCQGCGKSKHTK